MAHYWTADDPTETRREQVLDWIEDLIEFGADVVVDACRDWRRTQTRRPTPADLRRLCIERHRQQVERKQLTAPTDMDAYARSVGWANNAERMEAIAKSKRDSAADGERLRQIDQELKARQAERTQREALSREAAEKAAAEHMLRSQIALGIKAAPEPEPEEDREWATEELT